MPLPISVVIPCYKQERWVSIAEKSAWNADASEVLTYYDDDSFRTGVCYARNAAIKQAKYDLIFPLDADDRLYPDGLYLLYEAWQKGTWCYGEEYVEIDEDGNNPRLMTTPPPKLIFRKNLTYSSFLFHRDDWRKAGGYDPLFEFGDEDYAFQVALTDAGVSPIRLGGRPLYQRMIHPRGSRTERAVKYFPMVLELLREKYPATMHR